MVDCHYCKQPAKLVRGEFLYPRRPELYNRPFWYCDNGHEPAYVGCHSNSDKNKPLGILADLLLRQRRIAAHKYFDALWRGDDAKFESRRAAYKWLSEKLVISYRRCHIGMFGPETCKDVIRICKNEA